MEQVEYRWTDGLDHDFQHFYVVTEEFYSRLAGGAENRRAFIPHNLSGSISHVLIAYIHGAPVGCAGLRAYSDQDIEIKRVWVEPEYRHKGVASGLMDRIERKANELGYRRTILQTREQMEDAIALYMARGYKKIDKYAPYDTLDGALCFGKDL